MLFGASIEGFLEACVDECFEGIDGFLVGWNIAHDIADNVDIEYKARQFICDIK